MGTWRVAAAHRLFPILGLFDDTGCARWAGVISARIPVTQPIRGITPLPAYTTTAAGITHAHSIDAASTGATGLVETPIEADPVTTKLPRFALDPVTGILVALFLKASLPLEAYSMPTRRVHTLA